MSMKKPPAWTLLAWYYVAYGIGSPYPPQLFGPFISEEQCTAQAVDWTARGLPAVCLKSEIQGVPMYGGGIAVPAVPQKPAPSPAQSAKPPLMVPAQPPKK